MTLYLADVRVGAVLTTRAGQQRTVTGLDWVGGLVESVQYEIVDKLGQRRHVDCLGETWRRNCVAEAGAGGRYDLTGARS